MKTSTLFIILCLFIISCNKNSDLDSPPTKAELNIKSSNFILKDNVSANEDCDNISLTIGDVNGSKFDYNLALNFSKKGNINTVTLIDIKDKSKNYKSPLFNPKKSFKLHSFKYDSLSNTVSFHFEGTVFLPYTNDSLSVKGYVNNIDIKQRRCSDIQTKINGVLYPLEGTDRDIYTSFSTIVSSSEAYHYSFYTNDGLRFLLKTNAALSSFAAGKYPFDSEGLDKINISLEEYKGLSDKNYFFQYKPNEWKSFQTKGELEIKNQITSDGVKITTGNLKISIYNNQNIFANIDNGSFIIASYF